MHKYKVVGADNDTVARYLRQKRFTYMVTTVQLERFQHLAEGSQQWQGEHLQQGDILLMRLPELSSPYKVVQIDAATDEQD